MDVSVSASSDTGIVSILPTIKNSSGNAVTGSFAPQFTAMPKVGDKTFVTSGWKISALSTASAGSYTLTVTLTDMSGAITTKDVAFVVKSKAVTDPDPIDPDPVVGEPLIKAASVTAGAQSSSNGSFLELSGSHAGSLYKANDAFSSTVIDVVFGAAGTTPSFMAPSYAAIHGFDLSSWSTSNITSIVDMGTSKPSNSGVIDQALDANGTESVSVLANHYYGVGTTTGDIVMLYVADLTGVGRSANAKIDIYTVQGGSVVDPDPTNNWPKIDLGAQNATPPSALDVDGQIAYTAGAKTASQIASIDLLLYYDAVGELRFISPGYASDNALSVVSGWGTTNETYFYDNGTTPVTSLEQVEAILSGKTTQNYVKVVAGHYYTVEHTGGVVSVVKVESIQGSGKTAVIKLSIVFSDDTFAG